MYSFKRATHLRSGIACWLDHAMRRRLAALWPGECVLCHGVGDGADLCAACAADLPRNTTCCVRCARPLATPASFCGVCLQHAPPFDVAFAPFSYAYPLHHLVQRLKYAGDLSCGRVLGALFADALGAQGESPRPDVLLPMPLSTQRFCERGFNQAAELARWIGRTMNIPVRGDIAVRVRHTAEQAGLSRKKRRRNVRGAFAVRLAPPAHVAIIDDVITTGSTMAELARVLYSAGAERVEAWAIARAGDQR